jgi:hypothetical protein
MEIMLNGMFASKYTKGRNEYMVDATGWLHIGNNTHPAILMAYGDEDIQCLLNLELHQPCATELDFDVRGDVFKANIAGASFTKVTAPTWLKGTKEGRIEQVLNFYPHVPLCDLGNNLSMLEKNGKGFPDRSDLKVTKAFIKDINRDDEVTLGLVDETSTNVIQARVNSFILSQAGTGIGSLCYFIGTPIEKQDQEDFSLIMDICSIIPIERTPLRDPAASVETGRVLKISME